MAQPKREGAHGKMPAGSFIGRYEIRGLLGRGGMAAVYAARQRGVGSFERTLAIKVMLPHLVEDQSYLNMFLDEIRIVSRIDHPNVVSVLDVGEHDGAPFMAMEFLRGRTLRQCVRHSPPFAFVAAWMAQVADGLHGAHETRDKDGTWLQIVHRDVSAANVLIGVDGSARVLDFGIAAAVGRATLTQSGELKGRLSMMAPETITRQVAIDRRADVWSLGVLAWELCAGRSLFRGENEAETLWRVINAPVPELPQYVPPTIRAAIAGALQRDVERRLGTAAELGKSFAEHAKHEGVTPEALEAWVTEFAQVPESAEWVLGPDEDEPVSVVSVGTLDALTGSRGFLSRRWTVALVGLLVVGISAGAVVGAVWGGAEADGPASSVDEAASEPVPVSLPPDGSSAAEEASAVEPLGEPAEVSAGGGETDIAPVDAEGSGIADPDVTPPPRSARRRRAGARRRAQVEPPPESPTGEPSIPGRLLESPYGD